METTSLPAETKKPDLGWLYDVLFIAVLLLAAYFRFTGLNWDEGTYLHPDERFLAMVESSIEPVGSFGDYWNTQVSSLNPNNRGHGFFVYGTLPIFLVRYAMEWFNQVGYGEVSGVGRPLAAVFDLMTVFLLYLAASKLYDRRVGFLAGAFSAFAVLQIQLSHFFTVDIFANFFIWLAIALAAVIVRRRPGSLPDEDLSGTDSISQARVLLLRAVRHPLLLPVLLFGVVTGAAAASKISAFPVAFLLPLAAGMYVMQAPAQTRYSRSVVMILLMIGSGVLAALSFRLFQPYAFSGPGFFGVSPNMLWLESIGRLQDLVQPSSGYPPSVQWFNRLPVWFSGRNLTVWGLGLPLGLAAWAGFFWMGYRILRGDWQPHLLVWAWVAGHFLWQSTVPNPTMRYQLPIYPGLALMAAWGLVHLKDRLAESSGRRRFIGQPAVLGLTAVVLVGTFGYALAFVNIYRQEVTRIAASRWMYHNLPAAINLPVESGDQTANQLIAFPNGFGIRPGEPFSVPFTARQSGVISEMTSPHLRTEAAPSAEASLFLRLLEGPVDGPQLAAAEAKVDLAAAAAGNVPTLYFDFGEMVSLTAMQTYTLAINLVGDSGSIQLCEPIVLALAVSDGLAELPVSPPEDCAISAEKQYAAMFVPEQDSELPGLVVEQPLDYAPFYTEQVVEVALNGPGGEVLGRSVLALQGNIDAVQFPFDRPVEVVEGETYFLQVSVDRGAPVSFVGTVLAQETSWDDPLPMRVDGYDGFGGIYKGDNNLELYWDDNAEKVERISQVLDAVDVIPISSSRQWASLTRLPDRWPLVDRYYRELMGCPEDRTVEWCYNVAVPGMFQGRLGFELVRTFTSNPTLGSIEINDQPSEEAFTVYDHPKVFLFVKTEDYDPRTVRDLFGSVPLPGAAQQGGTGDGEEVKSLLLDEETFARQEANGTWSDLFSTRSLLNRFQPLGVLVWYTAVLLLGLAMYPVVRLAMPGLSDRGYPLARTAGLLVFSWLAWMSGSAGIPVTRGLLTICILAIFGVGGLMIWRGRTRFRREWRVRRSYFLSIEALALALFLLVLFIRMGNPDLWHPWKGGEKPMDFAYFNAVLRSVSFPPYDPWFSGGYINYYYYGFVFVGMLVKWLGIVPAFAYNLIIPTLFMLLGLGAFSIAWNLVKAGTRAQRQRNLAHIHLQPADSDGNLAPGRTTTARTSPDRIAYLSGYASALGVALIGNLGTLRMILQGYQRIAAPPDTVLADTFFLTRWVWTVRGFVEMLTTSTKFPYALADWYWNPSRAIPAPGEIEPITEFPFFTFLYADLHAHMLAMPIAILALAWALSIVLGKARWRSPSGAVASFFLGGLAIGALRPTNTWDYPTYLAIGAAAVMYTGWRYAGPSIASKFGDGIRKWAGPLAALAGTVILGALSWYMYQPYTESYALGYTKVGLWEGQHTPLSAYLTHWGLFLFLIISWMLWETREWLASVPAAAGLRYLRSKLEWIVIGFLALLTVIAILLFLHAPLAIYVLPLAAWAGVLMMRPDMPDRKRAVLFLIGTGLVLTLMVETIVLSGDIGRMNTVFKFYLQVWVLFGVSAAAALGWTLPGLVRWRPVWRRLWQVPLVLLAFSAFLYPLLGGFAKIKDRMAENAPITLNGMAYMPYASYFDQGKELHLEEDYRAIRWMQENISGTPVIVEGQVVEYRWGSRYSIYTGLPTVLGWNWHQRQQRTGHDLDVWDRANRIEEFYTTTNVNIANGFLEDFGVKYIIVGQMERAYYGGPGLDKFDLFEGKFWEEVYRDGETVIYRTLPAGGEG